MIAQGLVRHRKMFPSRSGPANIILEAVEALVDILWRLITAELSVIILNCLVPCVALVVVVVREMAVTHGSLFLGASRLTGRLSQKVASHQTN